MLFENLLDSMRMMIAAIFLGYVAYEFLTKSEPHWRTVAVKSKREISPDELLKRLK